MFGHVLVTTSVWEIQVHCFVSILFVLFKQMPFDMNVLVLIIDLFAWPTVKTLSLYSVNRMYTWK